MDSFFYLIVFLFGLAVGSFLNCVIYRLETGGNFLKGRSFCPHCKHQLAWQDLIPIFSFFWLRGRCRYCRGKISFQYPLVELATGILFVAVLRFTGVAPLYFIFYFVISSFLIIIFVYDLKHYIILDKVIYPAIGISFLFRILDFEHWDFFEIWNLGFGVLSAPLFFLAIILVSKGRWMGLGDVKLALLMGLVLGYPNILVALFLAFLIGAIMGIGLIILGKKTIKSEVPFGPFLVLGTFVALFWGEIIISWYLHLFVF